MLDAVSDVGDVGAAVETAKPKATPLCVQGRRLQLRVLAQVVAHCYCFLVSIDVHQKDLLLGGACHQNGELEVCAEDLVCSIDGHHGLGMAVLPDVDVGLACSRDDSVYVRAVGQRTDETGVLAYWDGLAAAEVEQLDASVAQSDIDLGHLVVPGTLDCGEFEASAPLLEDGWPGLGVLDGEDPQVAVPGGAGEDGVGGPAYRRDGFCEVGHGGRRLYVVFVVIVGEGGHGLEGRVGGWFKGSVYKNSIFEALGGNSAINKTSMCSLLTSKCTTDFY